MLLDPSLVDGRNAHARVEPEVNILVLIDLDVACTQSSLAEVDAACCDEPAVGDKAFLVQQVRAVLVLDPSN